MISLSNFLDKSDLTNPKGHLTSSGLTSPMKNPLRDDYSSSLILEYRPRDLPSQVLTEIVRKQTGSWSTPAVGDYDLTDDGLTHTSQHANSGLFFTSYRNFDPVDQALGPYNPRNKWMLAVSAFKIDEDPISANGFIPEYPKFGIWTAQLQLYIGYTPYASGDSNRIACASTTPVTLSSTFSGSLIDDYTLVAGNRILLMGQSSASENGIYTISDSPAVPARPTNYDSDSEIRDTILYVANGTSNGNKWFHNTNASAITVGVTSITYEQWLGPKAIAPWTITPTGNWVRVSGLTNPYVKSSDSDLLDPSATVDKWILAIWTARPTYVQVATTANIDVNNDLDPGLLLDGYTIQSGNLILVKNQSTQSQNGIYVAGAPAVRSTDYDSDSELRNTIVYVENGSANGGKFYVNTNASAITVGATSITYAEYTDDYGDTNKTKTHFNICFQGGQWSTVQTASRLNTVASTTNLNQLIFPCMQGVTLGLASCALSDTPIDISSDCIEWKLFDDEHTCGEYETSGNSIHFSCQGSVAWEYRRNGLWSRTDWYTDGVYTIAPGAFDAIRPVLKNNGLLNADDVALLEFVETSLTDGQPMITYPKIAVRFTTGQWRSVGPFTVAENPYTYIDSGYARFTFTYEGDDIYGVTVTNLMYMGQGTIYAVYWPYRDTDLKLGDVSGPSDVLYLPQELGRAIRDESMAAGSLWWALSYPTTLRLPLAIQSDAYNTIANMVAVVDWPLPPFYMWYGRGKQVPVFPTDLLAAPTPGADGESFSTKIMVKTNIAGSSSRPAWMAAITYYKTWVKTKINEEGWTLTIPTWIKQCHGYVNQQLENMSPFTISELQQKWDNWKSYFPWMVMWGQMSRSSCCSLDMSMHGDYAPEVADFAAAQVAAGYHIAYYSKPANLPYDSGVYIPWDWTATQVSDASTTPSPSVATTPISGCSMYGRVIKTSGSFSGVAVGDVVSCVCDSGSTRYSVVERVADSQTVVIYKPFEAANQTTPRTATFYRYSGLPYNSFEFFQEWHNRHVLFGADSHYYDVTGTMQLAKNMSIQVEYMKQLSPNGFAEFTYDVYPCGGLTGGSIVGTITSIDSGTTATVNAGSKTVTLSGDTFPAGLQEWDQVQVGYIYNFLDARISDTELLLKYPSPATQTNKTWGIDRCIGTPEKTFQQLIDGSIDELMFPQLARYVIDEHPLFMGESNNDWVLWGAESWVMRQAFLLGCKFDAMHPAVSTEGFTANLGELHPTLARILFLRDSFDWWDREPKYRDVENITYCPDGVQIRRFTDKNGNDLFAIDNWNQLSGLHFDYLGTSYPIPSDQLSIVDLTFSSNSSVLHNITADNVVFCYRDADVDSMAVALAYRVARGLPITHLIPLPCSDNTVITRQEYIDTIETPLLAAIQNLNSLDSAHGNSIWVIILGYHVPVAYYDDGYSLKAVASRLHRLGFAEESEYPNYTYDRKTFQYFNSTDAESLYITAVINAPTKELAIELISRSIDVDNQNYITGKVYVDPYGLRSTTDQIQYELDILDFVSKTLPDLGLSSISTTRPLDGSDPLTQAFRNDSFYWGWFTPRFSPSLFLDQSERRVFLYNADNDSASTITSELDPDGSDPWCTLAINIDPGYAACAGAVDTPGETAYLRPRPFFEALQRGASLGESFLFASPVVDWKIILVGDPLMVVNFPTDIPSDPDEQTIFSNNEGIKRTKDILETAIAYGRRQARLAQELLNTVVLSEDLEFENSMLYEVNSWANQRSIVAVNNLYALPVYDFLRFIKQSTNLTFSQWLVSVDEKTTTYMRDLLRQGIPTDPIGDSYIHSEGSWMFDFVYVHPRQTRENIFFRLQASRYSDFSNLVIDISSQTDITGWKYEVEPGVFTQIIASGFPSNFSGRRVRYIAPEDNYLQTTEIYHVRWMAIDINSVPITDWAEASELLIIRT